MEDNSQNIAFNAFCFLLFCLSFFCVLVFKEFPQNILLTLLDVRRRCIKCGTINLSHGAGGGPVQCNGHEGGVSDDRSLEEYGQTSHNLQEQNEESSICVQAVPVITCDDQKQKTLDCQNMPTLENNCLLIPVTAQDRESGVLVTSL